MICPYCGNKVEKVDSAIIYGRSYGDIMLCQGCDAYVGCHPNGQPKGTPANAELRELRKECHALFDPLWKLKRNKQRSRTRNYERLAERLEIPVGECHFGMMREDKCKQAIAIMEEVRWNSSI